MRKLQLISTLSFLFLFFTANSHADVKCTWKGQSGNKCGGFICNNYKCPDDLCTYSQDYHAGNATSGIYKTTLLKGGSFGNYKPVKLSCDVIPVTTSTATSNTTVTTPEPTPAPIERVIINEKLEMAENNPVANTFCRVYDTVLVAGFIIAAILWTVTGIGFFIGKISWGIVVAIGVGSALMVGSGKLAAKFVLGDSDIEDACDCRHGVDCDSPYE